MMELIKEIPVISDVVNYFTGLYEGYLWTLTLEEPYVQGWPLVRSPMPMLSLIFIYYHIVYFGPKLMKNREPFKLKWLLVVYNLGITILNLYIAIGVFYNAYKLEYSWICQPYNPVDTPEEASFARVGLIYKSCLLFHVRYLFQIAFSIYLYYISKVIEFSDTMFFIIRKKPQQLTFLHVYHHSTMFYFCWIAVKWLPGGSSFVGAGLNSVVHVFMYSYYALSAFGPSIRKYLWWKKYLTIVQLIQFTIALFLGINGLRINCDFPKWMQYTLITYMLSFIILFSNFYTHAYTKKRLGQMKKNDSYSNGVITNGKAKHMNGADLSEKLEKTNRNCYQNGFLKNISNGSSLSAYASMNGLTSDVINGVANGHVTNTDHNHISNGITDGDADIRVRKIAK